MKYLIAVFVLVSVMRAQGQDTAGDLAAGCRVSIAIVEGVVIHKLTDAMDAGVCAGFIEGWREGVTTVIQWSPEDHSPYRLEIEEGVSVGQISRVLVKYVSQHPEKENEPPSLGLVDALFDAKLAKYTKMPRSGYVGRKP